MNLTNSLVAKHKYETRICLFLDILGFSERIRASQNDPASVDTIVSAIDIIRSHFEKDDSYASKQITQFSDLVVVSYLVDERSSAFDLLFDTGLCLIRLAEIGFLMRGGIALGAMVHTREHLFGPAMNAAYFLESKTANYPRVIVQEDIVLAAQHAPAIHHEGRDEAEYVQSLLRRDFDGLLYIDYINWDSVVHTFGCDNDCYPQYLSTLSKLVSRYINTTDMTICAKYGWVARHYMKTKLEIEALPQGHRFRQENPGYVEQIAGLPSFAMPGAV